MARSGGPAPVELAGASILRTTANSVIITGGGSFVSSATGTANYLLSAISTMAPGTQLLIRNSSDDAVTCVPAPSDVTNDGAGNFVISGGTAVLMVASPAVTGFAASWFTFDP